MDTTLFRQKFFNGEMRGKNEKYGYFLMALDQMKPHIVNADGIAVVDEDLSKHHVSETKGDNAYKATLIRDGAKVDSLYILVDKNGVKSFVAMRKGKMIVSWW